MSKSVGNRYTQVRNVSSEGHFSAAVTGELVYSTMESNPQHLTTFNAGDIVPIYCMEVLPHDKIAISEDFVIRQNTVLSPTMGSMMVDFYAFFVPNRIVNRSWVNVMGENSNGAWIADSVSLAPLVDGSFSSVNSVQVPVGSVADFYGYPTQQPLPVSALTRMHDLKFRGYVEIYNEFFRDQNYQPPIPYSKLNIFQNFFHTATGNIQVANPTSVTMQNGSYGSGAVAKEVFGNISQANSPSMSVVYNSTTTFNALGSPLKANKLHDYFTSVLPSPLKGDQVLVPLGSAAPVYTASENNPIVTASPAGLRWITANGGPTNSGTFLGTSQTTAPEGGRDTVIYASSGNAGTTVYPANLVADLSRAQGATIGDVRMAAAVQQVYEQLARSGSRYREVIRGLFGLEVDNPYKDIPTYLGHFRRNLDLYQTAQTSASEAGSTPQGNLAAFGYTSNSGFLFNQTFLEHGYVHIFAVVRQRNVYPAFLARDNFRLSMFDWYIPQLANISEQPVYTREINPFYDVDVPQVFGYQEPWAEYRYDPDYVSGYMRPGISESLSIWNYADEFDSGLAVANGEFIQSNAASVLDRTLAVTSSVAPQLKGQFVFHIKKERPMPTYSLPGLDIF